MLKVQPTKASPQLRPISQVLFGGRQESVRAVHETMLICDALLAASGAIGAIGIANPRRHVEAAVRAGGQLVGAPQASLPQRA